MKIEEFREGLLKGEYCEKDLNVLLKTFKRSFYSIGKFIQYPEYKSFVIKDRDCGKDCNELEEILKYIAEKRFKIDSSVLQIPEEFVKRIDSEDISSSSKNYLKMIYAIYLFKRNYLSSTEFETAYSIWGATKICKMLEDEYRFNFENGMVEAKGFKIPISNLDKCIDLISMLNKLYGNGVCLKDNGTIILPDILGSGMTVIFYARTEVVEVIQKVMYPTVSEPFIQISNDVSKGIEYVMDMQLKSPLIW